MYHNSAPSAIYNVPSVLNILSSGSDSVTKTTTIRAELEFNTYPRLVTRFFQTGNVMKTELEVMWWYRIHKEKNPMISNFKIIIFAIMPYKIEDKRDFYLSGFIGWAKLAYFTTTNLSILASMNKIRDFWNPLKEWMFWITNPMIWNMNLINLNNI